MYPLTTREKQYIYANRDKIGAVRLSWMFNTSFAYMCELIEELIDKHEKKE